jgi:hypothetical protein
MTEPLRTTATPSKKSRARFWAGDPPKHCDICRRSVGGEFVDGKTRRGPWGNLCSACHGLYGVGFGVGRGQRYSLQSGGAWLNTTPEA